MFTLPADQEMTLELLSTFVAKHQKQVSEKYRILQDAYQSDHAILHQIRKPNFKPDNRVVVNFAKYIVDTMNGFFLGNPVKITHTDGAVGDYVDYLGQYSNQDDNNAELAKICDIFGKGYEMYYTDEAAELCTTYLSPMEAFMIFDESILERPLYFIRLYTDWQGHQFGSISDRENVCYFQVDGGYRWLGEATPHYFGDVPATEYLENAERQSIFEPVLTMIDAYNKAISEKANDVDYFADAYLKILGADLTDDDLKQIRDNRIIHFPGDEADSLVVEFLQKPDADATQEHLIDRLEKLIFQISMVANISDENFGTSSGIAMKYKLQAMSNLEKTKERKFIAGMNRRYKLLFGHPASKVNADAWVGLQYRFTPNIPANLLEESQIAGNLSGIVSQPTQLSVLSCVDNVAQEVKRLDEETDKTAYMTDYPTGRTDDELLDEKAASAESRG